jgi:predicted dehydrogenase
MHSPRRTFLKSASLTGAAVSLSGVVQANEAPLSIGLIGCGGMMMNHLKLLVKRKDIQIAWLCDVDDANMQRASKAMEAAGLKAPKLSRDLRDLLKDDLVKAVFIATPDHWHAPATILCCNEGKHVYVEKPCSHNIREGRLMIEAARRKKVIVQVGTQSRSTSHVMEAMKKLRERAIGEVLISKAWNSQLRRNIGKAAPGPVPDGLDFDLWLGPAVKTEYRKNLLHSSWRWFYDFGTGDMGNDGVHDLDIARWGLGVTRHPDRVSSLGGKYFFDDDQQFPDTMTVCFEYRPTDRSEPTRQLIYEHRIWSPYIQEGFENGNAFYGTKGMLILGKGGGWKLYGERNKLLEEGKGNPDLEAHHTNFFDCIKSGKLPNADIEIGHLSSTLCHLGNISVRTGKLLKFDPKSEQILDDPEANALVKRKYRDHFATPKGV